MLIKTNGNKDSDITPAPIQPHAKVDSAPPLTLKTIPNGKDGRSLPSVPELMKMMENPRMRAAISIAEREMGCETLIRRTVRKQLYHDRLSQIAVETQKKAIELSEKKKNGTL